LILERNLPVHTSTETTEPDTAKPDAPAISIPPAASDSAAAEAPADPIGIGTMRGQIDALDTAIARLVAERAQLSRRIQTARMNAGGTRVELGRERAILSHYRSTLGSEGGALGDAVLRVCRGARS
jgi:chorismate mutase